MTDQTRTEIAEAIASLIGPADEEVVRLGVIGLGTVLYRHHRRGDDWKALLSTHETEFGHAIDWIVSAVKDGDKWLARRDVEGRPMKLMKLHSVEQLQSEAEKSFRKKLQKLGQTVVLDEGEQVEMELSEGEAIARLTKETEARFRVDVTALGCLEPTHQPRATDNIAGMQKIILRLIERGHAYYEDGEVLFSVPSMPDYGRLSGRDIAGQRSGARIAVSGHKRSDADFVLWKASSGNEPGWESPWGRGRPGWHIECSAMSARYLGETFGYSSRLVETVRDAPSAFAGGGIGDNPLSP